MASVYLSFCTWMVQARSIFKILGSKVKKLWEIHRSLHCYACFMVYDVFNCNFFWIQTKLLETRWQWLQAKNSKKWQIVFYLFHECLEYCVSLQNSSLNRSERSAHAVGLPTLQLCKRSINDPRFLFLIFSMLWKCYVHRNLHIVFNPLFLNHKMREFITDVKKWKNKCMFVFCFYFHFLCGVRGENFTVYGWRRTTPDNSTNDSRWLKQDLSQ